MGNSHTHNGLVAEYVSEERQQALHIQFLQMRENKINSVIYNLWRFDNSNKYWYSLDQLQRNYLMETWCVKVRRFETNFCKGRKINIINNWNNNMKI